MSDTKSAPAVTISDEAKPSALETKASPVDKATTAEALKNQLAASLVGGVTEEKAKEIQKRADEGEPQALYLLHLLHAAGEGGVEKDMEKAFTCAKTAAEKGFVDAMFSCAGMYLDGIGVKQDQKEGLRWLKQASDGKHGFAMYLLAELNLEGFPEGGLEKDTKGGVDLLRASAETGFVMSALRLGGLLIDGELVPRDTVEGMKWLRMAAEKGHPAAKQVLAQLYIEGRELGMDKAKPKAKAKAKSTAEAGAAGAGAAALPAASASTPAAGTEIVAKKKAKKKQKGKKSGVARLKEESKAYEIARDSALKDTETLVRLGDHHIEQGEAVKAIKYYQAALDAGDMTAAARLGMITFQTARNDEQKKKAEALIKQAADAKVTGAHAMLATIEAEKGNVEGSFAILNAAAESGDPQSLFALAAAHMEGIGGSTPDFSKAVPVLQQCVEKGYSPAYYTLGHLYVEGKGVERDFKAAVDLFKKGAEKLHPPSMVSLGLAHAGGEGGAEKDDKKAYALYEQAASMGDPEACFHMGTAQLEGKGCEKNEESAVRLFQVGFEQGHVMCAFGLAACALEGKGMPENKKLAYQLFEVAAEQGHMDAAYTLASMLLEGEGCEVDSKRAMELFRAAAEQNHPPSQLALAGILMEGRGDIKADVTEARKFLDQAVEGEWPNAIYAMGAALVTGEYAKQGLTKDVPKGLEYLDKAIEMQSPDAMCQKAELLLRGEDVEKDEKTGYELVKQAAEQDHPLAHAMMGVCMIKGSGCDKDEAKGRELLASVEGKKLPELDYYLGMVYEEGNGVDKDLAKAITYYERAAKDHPLAKEKLAKLQSEMSL